MSRYTLAILLSKYNKGVFTWGEIIQNIYFKNLWKIAVVLLFTLQWKQWSAPQCMKCLPCDQSNNYNPLRHILSCVTLSLSLCVSSSLWPSVKSFCCDGKKYLDMDSAVHIKPLMSYWRKLSEYVLRKCRLAHYYLKITSKLCFSYFRSTPFFRGNLSSPPWWSPCVHIKAVKKKKKSRYAPICEAFNRSRNFYHFRKEAVQ